jgi:hypothetical protein
LYSPFLGPRAPSFRSRRGLMQRRRGLESVKSLCHGRRLLCLAWPLQTSTTSPAASLSLVQGLSRSVTALASSPFQPVHASERRAGTVLDEDAPFVGVAVDEAILREHANPAA